MVASMSLGRGYKKGVDGSERKEHTTDLKA